MTMTISTIKLNRGDLYKLRLNITPRFDLSDHRRIYLPRNSTIVFIGFMRSQIEESATYAKLFCLDKCVQFLLEYHSISVYLAELL